MNRSCLMLCMALCLSEVVPFGWLFVLWGAAVALPIVLFAITYWALVAALHETGRLGARGVAWLKSAIFRDKD